jgi:hypothetical protein
MDQRSKMFEAMEVAMKPGVAKLEAFGMEYDDYVRECQSSILQELQDKKLGHADTDVSRFAHLPEDFEQVEVIRSVLAAWVNPRLGRTPLCVLENREGYTVAKADKRRRSAIGRLRVEEKFFYETYSKFSAGKDDGPPIMPRWLRMAVGKLKLIPVGAYLGECGFHAAKDMFFVCPKFKKVAKKKGARK